MLNQSKLFRRAAVAALVLAGLSASTASSKASLIPVYIAGAPGSTSFNYAITFATNSASETLKSGDFVTLYDVALPATVNAAAPVGWTPSIQLTGTTPTTLTGALGVLDSPTIENVTFTYTGASTTTSIDTFGFSIIVPSGTGASRSGIFTSTDALTLNGGNLDQLGAITVPALVVTPEPMSAVASVGLLGLFASRRRSRR